MKESEIKYLSGLLDADGSLYFQFMRVEDKWRVYLRMVLSAAESVDREGKTIKDLHNSTGFGSIQASQIGNWSKKNEWVVAKWSELNQLLPRIIKHMVIKGRHWQWLLEVASNLRGKQITDEDKERLVAEKDESRSRAGPVRDKKHPTWAWLAGYLDGDGSYLNRYQTKKKYQAMRVNATSHINDKVGLELIHKAFGGLIYQVAPNIYRWQIGLGYRNSSFAIKFLRGVVKHSRLKKHQIEMILHNHMQRLSDRTPTGEATV